MNNMTPEKKPAKGKLAIYWAASCGGCEISILQIDAKILDVDAAFDLVFCPCIADGKVRDIEHMADDEIDVCLFNGGIRNSEQEYMARLLRHCHSCGLRGLMSRGKLTLYRLPRA